MAKRISFIVVYLLLSNAVMAQLDERYENDPSEEFKEREGSIQLLRLKKSYVLGDGITLRSSSGNLNLTQSLQTLYTVNTPNKNLSNFNSTFSIERARLTLNANIFDKRFHVIARVNLPASYQSVTTGNRTFNSILQEAYFEYRPSLSHALNIGLRADYIDSRETRIEGESLGFINRSAVSSSFDAIFDYGIRYKGIYKLGGRHLLRPYVSITTGDSRSALQKNYGGFRYGIRLDYLPFDKFSKGGEFYMDDLAREERPKLVIGVVYNYNNGATSASGTNGGRWLYGNVYQNIVLPNYSKFGVDYLFKYNGFYSLGSYFTTRLTVPSGIAGEFRLNGQFIPYSTSQSEEQIKNIVRSRINLGSGYNIQAGYVLPSNWAFAGRYTSLSANTFSLNFADYNKYYTFVATKYLAGHNLKIQGEIGFDQLKKSLKTATQAGNYYSQLMVTVQL